MGRINAHECGGTDRAAGRKVDDGVVQRVAACGKTGEILPKLARALRSFGEQIRPITAVRRTHIRLEQRLCVLLDAHWLEATVASGNRSRPGTSALAPCRNFGPERLPASIHLLGHGLGGATMACQF